MQCPYEQFTLPHSDANNHTNSFTLLNVKTPSNTHPSGVAAVSRGTEVKSSSIPPQSVDTAHVQYTGRPALRQLGLPTLFKRNVTWHQSAFDILQYVFNDGYSISLVAGCQSVKDCD